jgi:DNA-binding IclR family transcriptional regulator
VSQSRKTGRGTQTLDRAIRLLKMLASRSTVGWRLTDLAAQCELDKATAYRLLQALERHRLARQRASDRHYAPGPLLFELGLAFPALAQFQTACRPSLARLARRPGGAALLYLRSEEDFVCIARVGGATVRGLSVEVGTRRPLAVSAPGIAILLALPQEQGARILESNMLAVRRFGEVRVRSVQEAIRRSRSAGVALNLGDIVAGLWSFGVPIRDAAAAPFAAIGVTGHAGSYSMERVPEIVELLRKEAARIEEECAALIPSITVGS